MKQKESTYMLRILGGSYLVYLGLTLIGNINQVQGIMQLAELGCVVLFCTVGAVLGGVSIKELIKLKKLETCDTEGKIRES